ncbi:MAG: serine hydrolase [Caulobacter sp.]|nr:serine hydrolase [Caulobacter sp.]
MTLIPLPAQPADTPWPTQAWPQGDLLTGPVADTLDAAFAPESLDPIGRTDALLLIQGGRIVYERYGEGLDETSTFPSWSKAKSITQALTGLLVGDGKVDIHAPADVPEWQTPDDPRGAITLDQLLRMSSGLAFVEEYSPGNPSDVIEMLFGKGQGDTAAYAADKPLIHAPGAVMSYASGTTNIVARALARSIDVFGPDFEAFMRRRLFAPLGMTSAAPKFDEAGTFIGSSYCFATARDFARFGLLYLRGGVWEDRPFLPAGWADYARTRTASKDDPADPYGAHWWLGLGGPGSFSANGYEGQYTVLVPDLDLILVRHGGTPLDLKDALRGWIGGVVEGLRG